MHINGKSRFGNFAAIDGNQMIRHNSFSVALTVTQHGLEKDMTKQGTFAVIASVMLLALAGSATASSTDRLASITTTPSSSSSPTSTGATRSCGQRCPTCSVSGLIAASMDFVSTLSGA
jgi:hypothetical protein